MSVDRLRLARAEGVGPILYRRLVARYGDAPAALDALPELARAGGRATAPRVPSRGEAEAEIAALARFGARLLCLGDDDYPARLAEAEDAPPVLSVQGDAGALNRECVAIVGSRNASANGRRIAEDLATDLAKGGLVVVSGLARGIDAAAHEGALRTGRTVAAVAGGLDVPYPPEHAKLQARIAEAGAVVAEAPLGTSPQARHFPRRNRIIAGLARGVVVVEAALRSGSLITARIAADLGREVFAVPNSPLDPRGRGTNGLLRDGAHLTETAADVLDALPRLIPPPQASLPGVAEEQAPVSIRELQGILEQVLEMLGSSPAPVDEVIRRCQMPAAAVGAALMSLELAGAVEMLPGNRVARTPPAGAGVNAGVNE